MIKIFCDPCGQEIVRTANRDTWSIDYNNPTGDKVSVKVECMLTINGVTNGRHICRACIVRTVRDGDNEENLTR